MRQHNLMAISNGNRTGGVNPVPHAHQGRSILTRRTGTKKRAGLFLQPVESEPEWSCLAKRDLTGSVESHDHAQILMYRGLVFAPQDTENLAPE